jgi:hypothetical protein
MSTMDTQAQCYTATADAAVEQHVAQLLQRTCDAVLAQCGGELEAVVLTGGFGRGEGGVLRRADGRLHIVNDFDIELLYREPWGKRLSKLLVQWRHRAALNRLAERLAREFGMKQIDLTLRPLSSLKPQPPRLADYDLRYGNRLLWGQAAVQRDMPAYAATEIPVFEGTWLLRNRGIGLLLARLYLDQGLRSEAEVENFYIEINKAALAMGDALWILSGHYNVRYAERAARFDELQELGFAGFAELHAAYLQAAEYKLRPVLQPYPGQDREALWQSMARLYSAFFLWFEGQRVLHPALPFASLEDYGQWWRQQALPAPASALRRWLERRVGSTGAVSLPSLLPLKHQPLSSVFFVACMLAQRAAVAAEADTAARWLQTRWAAPAEGAQAWGLRARGLLSLLHPGGEVGRFLAAAEVRA